MAITWSSVDSYKILISVPGISSSQLIFNYRLGDLLASRGHEVTLYVAQFYESLDTTKRPKHAKFHLQNVASGKYEEIRKVMDANIFEDAHPLSQFTLFIDWIKEFRNICEKQISDKTLMDKLRNEKFDLAIGHMYDLCPLGMFKALNISSYIWMSSGVLLDYMAWYAGVPSPASFVPNAMSPFGDRMTLPERFKNLAGVTIMHLMYRYLIGGPYNDLFQKHFGADFPNIFDVAAKSPLIFVNSEELIDFPRPILHKVVYIGGIDTNQPEPLNEEWQKVMDSSKKGVVLFSFGSVVNAAKMPDHWRVSPPLTPPTLAPPI